jgi:hypothetical protein
LLPLVILWLSNSAVWAKSVANEPQFVAEHCADCHGEDSRKAGLRLDTLPLDFRDEKTAAVWTLVYDK